jgi:hypothetical protein
VNLSFALLHLTAALLGGAPVADPPATRVLFVGNSFTFWNDLPQLVAELGQSLEPAVRLDVAMVARDGMTLERHWQEGEVARLLKQRKWDVLVLQEQGSRPITNPELTETYVRRFTAAAGQAGAQVVLFQTWARLDAPETEAPRAAGYRRVAEATGAKVAPVGAAWQLALRELPGLRLHALDSLHASPVGSYLAACVLLGVISGRPPAGASSRSYPGPELAGALQALAWRVVRGQRTR